MHSQKLQLTVKSTSISVLVSTNLILLCVQKILVSDHLIPYEISVLSYYAVARIAVSISLPRQMRRKQKRGDNNSILANNYFRADCFRSNINNAIKFR